MDFQFSEEQTGIRDLAREILEREVTLELLKELQTGRDWFAAGVWSKLADANLLGLAVPEALGGMGFDLIELCVLLQEVGRAVAPIPALPSLVLAGLPIAHCGTPDQQARWLAPLAAGDAIFTAALVDADSTDPATPSTHARPSGAGAYRLEGRKRFVSAAHQAERILVPATTEAGVGLFALDPRAEGVSLTPSVTSTHEPRFELALDGAHVDAADVLGGDPDGAGGWLRWLDDCARVAVSALQLGVCERALEITTHYVSERVQFGAPIGSFPPVQHRAADCYIDLSALRWTTWRAAWALDRGDQTPSAVADASRHATIAKFYAAESGARIATAAQHLHGGMGADRDYPIHRYLLWSKSLELELGAAMPQLAALGRDMARTGPREFL